MGKRGLEEIAERCLICNGPAEKYVKDESTGHEIYLCKEHLDCWSLIWWTEENKEINKIGG